MGYFRQLLSLVVDHAFFWPRPCRALRFWATADTAAALRSTGCMLRQIDAGFELCHDQDAAAALRLQLAQVRPWSLSFLAASSDAQFVNYTESLGGPGRPLCFENWQEVDPGPGSYRQLRAEAANLQPSLQSCDWHSGPMPVCAVTLSVDSDILDRAPIQYRLSLAARATRWKYYFTGDWSSQLLRIVDAAGLLLFDAVRAEPLPDGRTAQVIVSSTAIVLQERPQQRLALRSPQGTVDKVLIKRLPLASPARLTRDSIANTPTWISEIYVAS